MPDPARPTPDFDVQTLRNPRLYSPRQVRMSCTIAATLNRGKFVLLEEPDER